MVDFQDRGSVDEKSTERISYEATALEVILEEMTLSRTVLKVTQEGCLREAI